MPIAQRREQLDGLRPSCAGHFAAPLSPHFSTVFAIDCPENRVDVDPA
jgi:hypothetical protein